MKIYAGNLSYDLTEDELRKEFESFGQVDSIKIIKDNFSGKSRGFGFIEMPNENEAQKAIEELNGKDLKGKNIVVNRARPISDRRRGGGRKFSGRGTRGFGGYRSY